MLTSFIHIIALATVLFAPSCNDDQPTVTESTIDAERTLIVYLSRTKNTQAVAKMIQKNVGGTLVALELVTPYPEHYQTTVNQVAEENRTGYLPPLKTKIDNIETYDYVFVGFPTWGMQLPPPVKSFLNEYDLSGDLSGKVIIPFNTHAGYGVGSGFRTIEELCPNSDILAGYSTKGGVERDGILFVMEGEKEKQVQEDVKEWLQEIGLVR